MSFKVQTDFSLPQVQTTRTVGQRKYPFNELPVGGMFFIPNKTKNTFANYTSSAGRDLGRKFTTRLVWAKQRADGTWAPAEKGDAGAVLGIGVWRLPDPDPEDTKTGAGEDDEYVG